MVHEDPSRTTEPLKMKPVCSSEISGTIYTTRKHNNREYRDPRLHKCEKCQNLCQWKQIHSTNKNHSETKQSRVGTIFMEVTPFCLLLNKPHLFSVTQYKFIQSIKLPSHVCYMFQPVLRLSSGTAMQEHTKEDTTEI